MRAAALQSHTNDGRVIGNLIHSLIADKVREVIAGRVKELRPRINFEADNLENAGIVDVLDHALDAWACEYFFWLKEASGKWRVRIVSKSDMKAVVEDGLDGSVVSIVNPSLSQGVTFDIDMDGPRTFTLTAWGSAEDALMASLARAFPEGVLFRGN